MRYLKCHLLIFDSIGGLFSQNFFVHSGPLAFWPFGFLSYVFWHFFILKCLAFLAFWHHEIQKQTLLKSKVCKAALIRNGAYFGFQDAKMLKMPKILKKKQAKINKSLRTNNCPFSIGLEPKFFTISALGHRRAIGGRE